MAVFLCHGKSVKKDQFADLYSNRPFGRVFDAIKEFEEWLAPMFKAAPENPFPEPKVVQKIKLRRAASKKRKLTKAQRLAREIVRLNRQGKSVEEIISKLGVTREKVTRDVTDFITKGKGKRVA